MSLVVTPRCGILLACMLLLFGTVQGCDPKAGKPDGQTQDTQDQASDDSTTSNDVTDVTVDTDDDGVTDDADNCPDLSNANQEDLDENGVGDLCQTVDADTPVVLSARYFHLVSATTIRWDVPVSEGLLSVELIRSVDDTLDNSDDVVYTDAEGSTGSYDVQHLTRPDTNDSYFVRATYIGGEVVVSDGFQERGVHATIFVHDNVAGPGNLSFPSNLAINSTGEILISDSDNYRIAIFSRDGAYIRSTAVQDAEKPYSIAVGPDDHYYVNLLTHFVEYSADDVTLASYGPVTDAWDQLLVTPENLIINTSTPPSQWQAGNPDSGEYFYSATSTSPVAIDLSPDGSWIFVVELPLAGNNIVYKYDREWNLLATFAPYGTGVGEVEYMPWGLQVSPDGYVYVPDSLNGFQIYEMDGDYVDTIEPEGGPGWDEWGIDFEANGRMVYVQNGRNRFVICTP